MPPWGEQPGGGVQEVAADAAAAEEENDVSAPSLRITGDALRRLVTEGTSGRTWPKVRGDLTKRPPLPFARAQSRPDPSPPVSSPPYQRLLILCCHVIVHGLKHGCHGPGGERGVDGHLVRPITDCQQQHDHPAHSRQPEAAERVRRV